MVRSELLTSMVLGLALTVFQSAQSMETGYYYPGNVSIANDILNNDLKCTYLFGGLTHMLLTKHLFFLTGPPFFSLSMNAAIFEINVNYSRIIKHQVESMLHLKKVRIGALWTLYLYMGMISGFYKNSLNKAKAGQAIIATHGYIIDQLVADLTDCRKNNSFDNYETTISSNRNPSINKLLYLINDNFNRALNLLRNNIILRNQLDVGRLDEYVNSVLQIGSIFLNNFGWKDDYKQDLMNVFNVQVDWCSTSYRLTQSWHDSRTLYWSTDKFANIKSYYILSFSFLKIIMFRLTLKHLCYLEPFFGTHSYVHYAKKWYNMVKQFGDMLCLSEDLHVRDLLISLDNLVKKEEKIDSVVNYLTAILTTLCLPLGCKAIKKFELDEKELKTPFKSPIKNEMNEECLKNKKSPVPIEYHSLEITRIFLKYLSRMFRSVDFNLIRSLVEYINEVSPSSLLINS